MILDLTTPIIKQDVYPYNFVTCKQAQTLSNQLAVGGKTSSLMFGIQWDLVLKFIEEKGKLSDGTTKITQAMLNSNSSDWGNYKNISFDITRGQYTTSPSTAGSWKTVTSSYTKPASSVLLTTGATNRNSTLNIYDLAGNVWEWTLEQNTESTSNPCCLRGSLYYGSGQYTPASIHNGTSTDNADYHIGSRPALY